MMKIWTFIFCCLLTGHFMHGQNREIDSLRNIVNHNEGDRDRELAALVRLVTSFQEIDKVDSVMHYTLKGLYYLPNDSDAAAIDTNVVILLYWLGATYQFFELDSAILMSTRALEYARRLNYRSGEAMSSKTLGENYRLSGDFAKALENLFNALRISREIHAPEIEQDCLAFIGIVYKELGEYRLGLNYMFQAFAIPGNFLFEPMYVYTMANAGHAYEKLNMPDSALYYQEKALHLADSIGKSISPLGAEILLNMGQVHVRLGNPKLAMQFYHESIRIQDILNLGISQYLLADLFYTLNQRDSSLHYARLGYINSKKSRQNARILAASRLLVKIFSERSMADSAFYYQTIALAITDSLYNPEKFNKLQLLAVREQQNKFEIIQAQQKARQAEEELANRIRIYGLLAALAVFLLIALILIRNNRQKQRANALLEHQKNEIAGTLSTLKATQAQLLQSEKMASLGELTAGIAHEIQNPLNFVNNFSEVNKELIGELKSEKSKERSERDDELQNQLLGDIEQNLEKIIHHGKRADAIVKGMLQHSRSSSGQKEPTDINALADEYLRLAYHACLSGRQGFRAKGKSLPTGPAYRTGRQAGFDAVPIDIGIKTSFDPAVGKINIVPQEIGRVLVNLFNNAFHAVHEKKKRLGDAYEPLVSISSVRNDGNVEIRVSDNGDGIPEKIRDKIFQPFFTTKPTGEGTGLGLSLAYDIIKKGHGGDLTVDTKEGIGSEFVVVFKNT